MTALGKVLGDIAGASPAEVAKARAAYEADRSGQLVAAVMGELQRELGGRVEFVAKLPGTGRPRESRVHVVDFLDRFDRRLGRVLHAAVGKARSDILVGEATVVCTSVDGAVTDEPDAGYRHLRLVIAYL